jgi:fibronectin type 3 domain-containing protein
MAHLAKPIFPSATGSRNSSSLFMALTLLTLVSYGSASAQGPAPCNLIATPASTSRIGLKWSAPASGAPPIQNYRVFRGTTTSNLSRMATVAQPAYMDASGSPATRYYYAVEAADTLGNVSLLSAIVPVTMPRPPAAPARVSATAVSAAINLTWSAAASGGLSVRHYHVFRGNEASNLRQVAVVARTSYTDRFVNPTVTYYYAVEAVDAGADLSARSATVSAKVQAPAAPTNLVATPTSTSKISLTWSAPARGGPPVQNYDVYRGSTSSNLNLLAVVPQTSYTDTSVSPALTYYFAVRAADTGAGLSPMSATVTATVPSMPSMPTGLLATSVSTTTIGLTWSVPASHGLPIENYRVFRGTTGSTLSHVATVALPAYTDTSGSPAERLYYAVQAADSGADLSAMSATISATTLSLPTPTATNADTLPPFRLTVAGDSQLFLANSAFYCPTFSQPDQPPVAPRDGPDSPVVFFRDANRLIHMFVAGGFNFAFTGTSFDNLKQNCSSVYPSHWNSEPLQYQYNEWLRSPYSIDGAHVYGVVHDEYHCTTADPSLNQTCSYDALTQVNSADGGYTFTDEPMPERLVATIPYQKIPAGTSGVGDSSNIIKNPNDGYYYMEAVNHSFGVGPCMLRSRDLSTWYAWNGTSFSVLMNDPNAYNNPESTYSCAAILEYPLNQFSNIRYLPQYNLFLGVGDGDFSIFYAVSSDLVHWSAPVLLFAPNALIGYGSWQPGDPLPVGYEALIDPESTALNLDVVSSGDSLYLYMIRVHTYVTSTGVLALDNSNRDIVSYPLTFSASSAQSAAVPAFSPTGGIYTQAQDITLSCPTLSSTIYYTTNGYGPALSTPYTTEYKGPVTVLNSQTIKAVCVAANYGISPVSSVEYTIAQ